MEQHKNPIVFISYSQDSISFADRVLSFSNRLRSEGIDAILDQYEEAPIKGWPRWMEDSIDTADYVLVVASKGYFDKIRGNVGQGEGRGVKWEGSLIYQKLYMSDSINTKYIPIVFDEDDIEYIPTPLQASTYYNVSDDDKYNELYWRLRGFSSKIKPPLGKLRPLPKKERRTLFITSMVNQEAWDKAVWRGAGFLLQRMRLPALLLLFKNEKYAIDIFEDWISKIGNDDRNENVRIALVEGDVPREAPGYYVIVGSNIDEAIKRAESQGAVKDDLMILHFSRVIRAYPKDCFRLYNSFKEIYQNMGEYILMPAIINEQTDEIRPLPQFGIHKKRLIYRDISDISENDRDAIVFLKDKRN